MLLAVVLMVKNEAETLEATLRPFLTAGILHFYILDTGSTDATVAIAHELLQNSHATYYLEQEPFVDFSTSRNLVLQKAENVFADIPFLIMPDAEWYLQNVSGLLKFCESHLHSEKDIFLIKIIMNNGSEGYIPRVFRTHAKIRFAGPVHETPSYTEKNGPQLIDMKVRARIPGEIHFNVDASHAGMERTRARWTRDLEMLNNYLATQSQPDPRALFYLAQTYECLNHLEQAYKYYALRAGLMGWPEETYLAYYRLGRIGEWLARTEPNSSHTWEVALQHFHRAISLRPHRAEPLVRIAEHFWPDNAPLCYLYASRACSMPYPSGDTICIEKEIYDYTRFEILSRAAWFVGKYKRGLEATKRALAVRPFVPHLLGNLKIYQDKTGMGSVDFSYGLNPPRGP